MSHRFPLAPFPARSIRSVREENEPVSGPLLH
jgi:hypothetical protein